VLERGRVGERWRTERWDSLMFQFPNSVLSLPGLPYDGPDAEVFSHARVVRGVRGGPVQPSPSTSGHAGCFLDSSIQRQTRVP